MTGPPLNDAMLRPPPVGVIVTVVVATLIAGAAAAQFLYSLLPTVAWLVAVGLCGTLFALGRLFARGTPTPARFLALLGCLLLTFSYLMVLGGESTPRPAARGVPELIIFLLTVFGIIAAALALPALIMVGALWRRREAASPGFTLKASPRLIAFSLGPVMLILGLVLLAVVIRASPPAWRLGALLALGFGFPVLMPPIWAYAYLGLLARWEATPLPESLLTGLQTLRDRIGFAFDRIQCLEATFGGRVCQVVKTPGRSTLIISESIPRDLTPEQLLAVLAHEAAHVSFGHAWRKVAWGTLGTAVTIAITVGTGILIAPFVPRSMAFAGVLVAVLPVTVLRGLYDTFVVRRHEAEADDFAIDVTGGTALLGALDGLGGSGPPEALVRNHWTTHGTWKRRASRIRGREKSA